MSSKPKWMPSPSMAVALIALFVALGGTALAFHLGKNAVKSKNIKPGAVHTSDLHRKAVKTTKIANNAVKTAKLAARSVTTAKLAEGAVGTAQISAGAVKTAQIGAGAVGSGQLAANAVGNSQTALVKVFQGRTTSAAASRASAPRVELGSVGPFRFYGKCFHVGSEVEAAEYVELTGGTATLGSADGAAFQSNETGYLTAATAEEERALESVVTKEADSFSAESGSEAFQASASDGTQITGLASGIGAKAGSPPAGNGPFPGGDSCILGTLAVFGGSTLTVAGG